MKFLQKIKEEPTIYLFRKTWKYAGQKRLLFVLGLILLVVSALIVALEPLVVAKLFNEVQTNGVTKSNISTLLFITALLPFVMLTSMAIFSLSFYMRARVQLEVINNYKRHLLDQVFNRPIAWIDDHDSGSLIDKTNKASQALVFFMPRLGGINKVIIVSLTSLIAVYYYSGAFFSIVLGTMALIFYIITLFDAKIIPIVKQVNKLHNDHSGIYYDIVSNATSVKVLSIIQTVSNNVQKAYEKIFLPQLAQTKLNEIKWFVASFGFTVFVFTGAFVAYYFQVINAGETVLIGSLAALYQYLNRLDDAFFLFSNLYSDLRQYKADNENAEEIENFEHSKIDRLKVDVAQSIRFNEVKFDYSQDQQEFTTLRDVSLTIQQGQRVALIGQSGSGKTTFLKLLHGMYEGAIGDIYIDGEQIHKQLHEIDLSTTLVPQDPELFSSTIEENITFGLDYNEKSIRKVTDLAMFTEVVDSLADGFASRINEKGVNLSGGQKQRLALARALLFALDKNIILLDESTSSVDPEIEVEIYQNIFNHFKGKTFIASIHKMNLLKYFDMIIMFEDGTVVDQGSFEDLFKRNDKFKLMWESFIASNS
ncbi:MAG: ABC transporter ATP-binding protein [Patescibacteria group bacterium]